MLDLVEFVFEIFGEAMLEVLGRGFSVLVRGTDEMVRSFWH